jgi:hypothetical protein
MAIIRTYNLFLSSAHRTSGTSSEYRITLYKPISLLSPNNYFTVRVGSAEIPYVFKLITTSNNVIQYSITRNAVTTNTTFTIEPGNYNILNLLTEVTTKLKASIQTAIGFNAPLNLTYDRTTGHATFSIVGTDSIATSITISNNSPVFIKCVGFSNAFTFGYTTPLLRTDVESTQNVNVLQNYAIYIRSDTLIQTQNTEAVISSSEPSDILAKLQVQTLPQTMIQWTNPNDLTLDINNRIIDEISLYVGSSTDYTVDLGGLDWTCRLTIDEHSDMGDSAQDIAINMSRNDPQLMELLKQREQAVSNLKSLKEKLIPKQNAQKTE